MAEWTKPIPAFSEEQKRRFFTFIDKREPEECWPWTGHCIPLGYGQFTLVKGSTHRAHRIAYFFATQVDPGPLFVCHSCDNPPCCNPKHLEAKTHSENMKDMRERGRSCVGDKNGTRIHQERMPRGEQHHTKRHPEWIKRGEACHTSVLSRAQAEEIRRKYEPRKVSCYKLAEEYGVKHTCIWKIVNNKTHVYPPSTDGNTATQKFRKLFEHPPRLREIQQERLQST